MSNSNICRLCRTFCDDSIRLFNVHGDTTEIYIIALKFFHPMFFEVDTGIQTSTAVLCADCWHHISSFNNFQQTVVLIQAKLQAAAENVKKSNANGNEPMQLEGRTINDLDIKPNPEIIIPDYVLYEERNVIQNAESEQVPITDYDVKSEMSLNKPQTFDIDTSAEKDKTDSFHEDNDEETVTADVSNNEAESLNNSKNEISKSPQINETSEKNDEEIADDGLLCSVCGLCCGDETTLLEHSTDHIEIIVTNNCRFCDRTFNGKYGLYQHIALSHPGEEKPRVVIRKCRICPKNFSDKSERLKHEQRTHPKECEKLKRKRRRVKKPENLIVH
ncbi:serendipity locus protein delta-like [Musca domestica]|uniref:Serendipity locus protein delta-like n=1 Tax=Musca domestica TaxID=7370 RepID=A0ABM3V512_MUSDO|nr:serendipity locus protein delta-like [Musca domestica]